MNIKTTGELLNRPITLLVNRGHNDHAMGSVFLDKGQDRKELDSGQFEHYKLVYQMKTLQKFIDGGIHGS